MVQENLHQELYSILGKDGNVTSGNLAKLSYLKACVKESARQVNLSSTMLAQSCKLQLIIPKVVKLYRTSNNIAY